MAPSATPLAARPPAPGNSGAASRGSANGHLSRCASTASASQAASSSPSPPRPPSDGPPVARRQGAPGEGKGPRRGERRRPAASGAIPGGVDRHLQRLVVWDPQNRGGGLDRGPPLPGRATDELPPGEQMLPRRPRIGARPGEMQRVAQRRRVLGAAASQDAGGGGAERQSPAENAGPGWILPDDRVEPGERRAGQKGGFGLAFRRPDSPRPGGKRRQRGRQRPRSWSRIRVAQHGERLPHGGAFA